MDSLERLEGKLDKLVDTVASIDKTLAAQAVQLAEHMRRTDLLEKALSDVRADLKPLQDKVQQAKGMSVLVGFLVTLAETLRHFIKG